MKTEGLATKIAKGTGNIILDTITGSTTQDIARMAGQMALAHQEPATESSQSALLLDPSVVFDIWVEEAF